MAKEKIARWKRAAQDREALRAERRALRRMRRAKASPGPVTGMVREKWEFPAGEAYGRTGALLRKFPKDNYLTRVEDWKTRSNGRVSVVISRLSESL